MGKSLDWFSLCLLYSIFRLNSHLEREAHDVYLLAPASKIHERGSPRRGTLRSRWEFGLKIE